MTKQQFARLLGLQAGSQHPPAPETENPYGKGCLDEDAECAGIWLAAREEAIANSARAQAAIEETQRKYPDDIEKFQSAQRARELVAKHGAAQAKTKPNGSGGSGSGGRKR